jgi:hypothetical protein
MTTVQNAFKINGSSISHQPTDHRWVNRNEIGITGDGHAVYPAIREYELTWDFLTPTEFNEIYTHFLSIGTTGSVAVELPRYANSSYSFYAYSGCILREPTFDAYHENYYTNVKLLIARIQT